MFEHQQSIQKLIVLYLTLKALEVDRQYLIQFKTVYAFSEWKMLIKLRLCTHFGLIR